MDKLIVECAGNMEFIVDAKTLVPLGCSYYDPYPNCARYPKAHKTISYSVWLELKKHATNYAHHP